MPVSITKPARAPHLVRQAAHVLVRRFVDSHHGPQPLDVESPPFAVSGERRASPEGRTLRPFERQRRLEAVTRRALVQRERDDRVQRARRKVIGVHQARFEPAASARKDRCDGVRYRANTVTAPRQEADGFREPVVGLLRHVGRESQQFPRRLGVELRIGPEKGEEFRHRALELCAVLGRAHLGLETRDFLQAGVVNLLRGEGQRGVLDDLRLVERFAIRQVLGPNRAARLLQVLLPNHRQQFCVGRSDDVANHRVGFGAERVPIGGRNAGRHLGERGVERIAGVTFDVGLDGLIASNHRHARHRVTTRQAGTHVGDLLVEVARHVAQPREIRAIRCRGGEALARRERGPEERIAVEGRFVGAVLDVANQLAQRGAEDLRVDLFLGGQLVEGDGIESGERFCPVGEPRLL